MRKELNSSIYHSLLRVAVCVLTLVLIFDSGLLIKETSELSSGAQNFLANAVGVRVGVAPNELNVLTARITELEQELKVKDREIAVNLNNQNNSSFDTSTFVLSTLLFLLLLLIIINYILDYLRSRPPLQPIGQEQNLQRS